MSQTEETNTFTLWSEGYSYSRAMAVEIVNRTAKAIQVQVVANPKCKLWFPLKAISFPSEYAGDIGCVAKWFTLDQFASNMFDRFGNSYKR